MKKGLIYKITNNLNNKKYIGLTTRDFDTRVSEYHYYYENFNQTTPIFKAFEKYGIENFTFEIVEENIPNDILDEREIYYIKHFQSKVPYGYNATDGGRIDGIQQTGRANAKGVYRIDIGTYEIIDWAPSLSEMARRLDTSTIRISDVCNRKAYTAQNYIFRFDNDYKKSEVQDFHNQKRPDTHIPVVAYYLFKDEIIGEYPSIYQASKETGISASSISQFCKGERDKAGTINGHDVGFKYGYRERCPSYDKQNELAEQKRRVRRFRKKDIFEEPVVLYNKRTGEVKAEFDSILEAEKAGWPTRHKIRDCAIGKKISYFEKDGDRYTWRFVI